MPGSGGGVGMNGLIILNIWPRRRPASSSQWRSGRRVQRRAQFMRRRCVIGCEHDSASRGQSVIESVIEVEALAVTNQVVDLEFLLLSPLPRRFDKRRSEVNAGHGRTPWQPAQPPRLSACQVPASGSHAGGETLKQAGWYSPLERAGVSEEPRTGLTTSEGPGPPPPAPRWRSICRPD